MKSIMSIMFLGVSLMALSCSDKKVDNPEVTPPPPEPSAIYLSTSNAEILPNGSYAFVTGTLVDEAGDTLADGYSVRFEITAAPSLEGAASPSFEIFPSNDSVIHVIDIVTGATGQATVRLYSGTEPGAVRIRASYLGQNTISTEQDLVRITPYPVGGLILTTQYTEIDAGGDITILRAELINTYGEPVDAGYPVRFEIIEAPSYEGPESPSFNYEANNDSAQTTFDSETNSSGQAEAILFSGTRAGMARVKATYSENENIYADVIIFIMTAQPAGIVLSCDLPEIPVGYSSTIIYATVIDQYGNPLGEGYGIRFEITAAPSMWGHRSVSFLYPPSEDSLLHQYETFTNGAGQAHVQFYSGIMSGHVAIKATILDDESIFDEEPLITIMAGPIYRLQFSMTNQGYAENDSIYAYLSVTAWDQYLNPVVDPDLLVFFDVIPDTMASIISPVSPDSNGLIYTLLSYICYHTFDTVRVIASAGDIVDTSESFILPIYNAIIDIDADPAILFVDPPAGNYEESEITASLTDGLHCPIHNGAILFSINVCGEIAPGAQTIDTTDDQGYAYTTFRIYYEQIPEREPPLPPACSAVIRGRLRGYPDIIGETNIFCTVPE